MRAHKFKKLGDLFYLACATVHPPSSPVGRDRQRLWQLHLSDAARVDGVCGVVSDNVRWPGFGSGAVRRGWKGQNNSLRGRKRDVINWALGGGAVGRGLAFVAGVGWPLGGQGN